MADNEFNIHIETFKNNPQWIVIKGKDTHTDKMKLFFIPRDKKLINNVLDLPLGGSLITKRKKETSTKKGNAITTNAISHNMDIRMS